MTEHFKNFVLDNETLNFDVYGLTPAFCNALRRIIISEVETLGFRTSYDDNTDIKIEINTSALHNEFLGHRLSLLPIIYPPKDISSYEKDSLEFIIDEVNKGENTIDITTQHIKILDKRSGTYLSEAQTRVFFPPNPITKDFILINKLKSNKVEGTDGEQIKLLMLADKGIGQEHSRYTPTCVSVFINKIDNSKLESALKAKLSLQEETLSAEEITSLARSFKLSEGERHFYTDGNGEPNVFEFIIESDGRIPPHIILHKGIHVLEDKINKLKSNLNNEEVVSYKNSDCIMNSYDILVKDEDYTLGYIIQQYIYILYQDKDLKDVKYVSTSVPHPLENNLLFRIALENNVDKENSISNIKKIIGGTIDHILSIIVKLKGEMKNTFKANLDL
jgi:DNA-directed RNA polymerase subunit L